MRRALAPVLAVGILGSQAGHLLVFQLRFGAAAQQVQSSGAHAYFPALAKTMLGAAAAIVLVPVAATIVSTCDAPTGSINRRGPPSF